MEYFSHQRPLEIRYNVTVPEHLTEYRNNIEEMRKADLILLDQELRRKGSSIEEKVKEEKIWRMKFPHMIYGIDEICKKENNVYIDLHPMHPHRADLTFKKDRSLENVPGPLTVTAIVETEGNLIFGLRGGFVESGKIGFIPGGHADYHNSSISEDIGRRALHTETEEELGLTNEEYSLEIFGIHENPETNGHNIIARMSTHLSLAELEQKRKEASDAWEHSKLVAVPKQILLEKGH